MGRRKIIIGEASRRAFPELLAAVAAGGDTSNLARIGAAALGFRKAGSKKTGERSDGRAWKK